MAFLKNLLKTQNTKQNIKNFKKTDSFALGSQTIKSEYNTSEYSHKYVDKKKYIV